MGPQEDVVRLEQSTVSMNGTVVVVQHVPVPQVLEVTPLDARHVSVERTVTVIQQRLSKYDCYLITIFLCLTEMILRMFRNVVVDN